jgi:hypothetical protein
MYGSLLEDKDEEAADVYVYRVAEYKALQIGKVSRLLKETSVDCILNYEQSNFSQEVIEATLKDPIEQILSNGQIIKDFKVGDAPYSAACDYMADCQYKCRPFKVIEEADLLEDTYNENFIAMNSEKIIQKIRNLMKERFFYKKNDLIERINAQKKYPLVQIYAALTQLVGDNNEFITDRFGRTGHLINIDEYYLFQPTELTNDKVSIFERSVPIDYKHNMIKFDTKLANKETKKILRSDLGKEENALLEKLKQKFALVQQFKNPDFKYSSKEEDKDHDEDNVWYVHCGNAIRKMDAQRQGNSAGFDDLVIGHIIDVLLFDEKLELLNYLYSLSTYSDGSFETLAKDYLDRKILKTQNLTAMILYDMDKRKIVKLDEIKNKWIDAEPEDIKDLSGIIKETFAINADAFNSLVGFIGHDDKKKFMVFKLKNTKEKRHTGARCDQKTKAKSISIMNEIVGEAKFNKENMKGITQADLCPMQELMLRSYNKDKKNSKLWFLDPETAKIYGF